MRAFYYHASERSGFSTKRQCQTLKGSRLTLKKEGILLGSEVDGGRKRQRRGVFGRVRALHPYDGFGVTPAYRILSYL